MVPTRRETWTTTPRRLLAILLVGLASTIATGETAPDEEPVLPMSDTLRQSFPNIVVRAGSATAGQFVTGSYGKDTLTIGEGYQKGKELGTIEKDIGGIPVYFPIRIISVPASILGALAGGTQEEIQKFRDRLTRDLIEAQDSPMTNDALASDVFWLVRGAPGVNAKILTPDKELPATTDAVLYVNLESVQMTVEETMAVMTTTAKATLRRMSDGEHVFEQTFRYVDRDELKDWIKDDDAAWHSYAAYARHYLAREIALQVYERNPRWEQTRPAKSADIKPDKKKAWAGKTRSTTPTLAWEISVSDDKIDMGEVAYDVEIYDAQQMVYAERRVPTTQLSMPIELERCKTYRWSVRPSYREGSALRYGEWMRFEDGERTSSGGDGVKASVATAYLYDFPELEIACR